MMKRLTRVLVWELTRLKTIELKKNIASMKYLVLTKKKQTTDEKAYNHVERRSSQGKRDGNGGDLVHWSFEVSVPLDALEQPLLLQKLLSWPKWCFRQHDTATPHYNSRHQQQRINPEEHIGFDKSSTRNHKVKFDTFNQNVKI